MKRAAVATAGFVLSWSMAASAPAQEPAPSVQEAAATSSLTADEDFELNITDRRITEENFEASTAVEIRTGQSEEQGLAVRVGARVGARRIDVRLRNVRGHVRFVASLEEVQEVIDSHRSEAAAR